MHFGSDGVEIGSECAGRGATTGAKRRAGDRLRGLAAVLLALASTRPSAPVAAAQQTAAKGAGSSGPDKAASNLPAAPAPELTQPLLLLPTGRDFSKAYANFWGAPWKMYHPTTIGKANFENSVRLADLVKDGKIYLSLSDALALALENNYDIAIARYNLDIADTDILRARAGSTVRGVNSGVVANTIGGSSSTLAAGGGPGGTTGGSGGAASGSSGLVLSTNGAGPLPENRDPVLAGTIQLERQKTPQTNLLFSGGKTA